MKGNKLIPAGVGVLAAGLLIGFVGAFGGIGYSYWALSDAELHGIDAVGNGIVFGLVAAAIGLVGLLAGICMITVGIIRNPRSSDTGSGR